MNTRWPVKTHRYETCPRITTLAQAQVQRIVT